MHHTITRSQCYGLHIQYASRHGSIAEPLQYQYGTFLRHFRITTAAFQLAAVQRYISYFCDILSDGSTIGGLLFADDFVGVSNSEEELQRLINVAHAYCCKWRLKANVSKSAVVVFARELVEGSWNWGEHALPRL